MKLLFQPNRLHKSVLAIWLLSLVLLAPQLLTQCALAQQNTALVEGVNAIGMTVSDMDRALDFYSKVLMFEKVSDTEVDGENYEHLEGVFGLRMRVVRMRLGHPCPCRTCAPQPRGPATGIRGTESPRAPRART